MLVLTLATPALGEHLQLQLGEVTVRVARGVEGENHTHIAQWLHDITGEQHSMAIDDFGKPYWPGSRWQFNYSHSRDWLALAVAQQPVGLDIESTAREPRVEALVQRYFHANEQALSTDLCGFLQIWTRKEAVLKAQGLGLRIELNSLDTSETLIHHPRLGQWHASTWAVGSEAVLSLAVAA